MDKVTQTAAAAECFSLFFLTELRLRCSIISHLSLMSFLVSLQISLRHQLTFFTASKEKNMTCKTCAAMFRVETNSSRRGLSSKAAQMETDVFLSFPLIYW